MFGQDSSEDVSITVGEDTFTEVAITFAKEDTEGRSVFTMKTDAWDMVPKGPNGERGRPAEKLYTSGFRHVDRVYRPESDPAHLKIRFYADADLSTSNLQEAVNIVLDWVNGHEQTGYSNYRVHNWEIEVASASEDHYRYNN